MTTVPNTLIGTSSTRVLTWNAIDWQAVEIHVQKLQLRIAKAISLNAMEKAEKNDSRVKNEL